MSDDPDGTALTIECEAVRPLLGAPLAEVRLDEAVARQAREHLSLCAACREIQAGFDPAALFLELRGGALPGSFWTGFDARLKERLDEPRFAWASLVRAPRLVYLTAPLMMILALGVTMLVLRPGGGGWRKRAGIQSPFVVPSQPGTAGAEAGGPPFLPPGTANGAAVPAAGYDPVRAGRPMLEQVSAPGARVYQFLVGAPGDETPIYLVVDESINI